MAEIYPSPVPSEERLGNVIRRRRGAFREATRESREIDYVAEFKRRYGDPTAYRPRERHAFSGRLFDRILGKPDVDKINTVGLETGLIKTIKASDGADLYLFKRMPRRGNFTTEEIENYSEFIGQNQGQNNPYNPQALFPKRALEALKAELGIPYEDSSRARYETCVGTAYDHSLGIDGYFVVDGEKISFDITLKDEKPKKADILITEEDISLVHEMGLVPLSSYDIERAALAEKAFSQQMQSVARQMGEVYRARRQKVAVGE